jgi:hypothetical protein
MRPGHFKLAKMSRVAYTHFHKEVYHTIFDNVYFKNVFPNNKVRRFHLV